ncbi:MAG: Glu/Leu/Phe/Val dehydrogenase dimerization domain-containing protein [Alphaproteobacteria bacterium]
MPVFASPDFDNHELVAFGADPDSGLRAIIGIHNTNLGPALGGCRMWPYADEDAALRDALRLSRGMTYKAAITGLPYGGGKSVIIGDPRTGKTEALLRAMGRFVDSLGGRYHTAEDVGTTVADMDVLRKETRYAHGFSASSGDPSPATAYGVLMGIQAALAFTRGSDDLRGRTVAVQGLGNVGRRLCRYLADAGAHLLVADIDAAAVDRAIREFGATPVSPDAIHRAKADVFAPCALGAILNDRTIPALGAPIVAGSANNQLAEPRHGAALKARGVLYAPDYVINAGGLIDVYLGENGDEKAVLARTAKIYDTALAVFERAAREDAPTGTVADRIAEERFRGGEKRRAAA